MVFAYSCSSIKLLQWFTLEQSSAIDLHACLPACLPACMPTVAFESPFFTLSVTGIITEQTVW